MVLKQRTEGIWKQFQSNASVAVIVYPIFYQPVFPYWFPLN